MATYTMDDMFEEVVIELDDHRFKLREMTRSQGTKNDKLVEEWEKLERAEADEEALVDIMLKLLDVMLEPLGDGNNGTRTHAKTLLKKAYDADRVGLDRILSVVGFCQQKAEERSRPTSARGSAD